MPSNKVAPPEKADSNLIDLGVLELSDKEPSNHELADGKTVMITATVLPNGKLDIRMDIKGPDAHGNILPVGMMRTFVSPNQSVELSVRDISVKFTPQLKRK